MTKEQDHRKFEARINTLESQVKFLMRINGLEMSALRTVSDDVLLKLYQDAVQLLGIENNQIPPEALEKWAETFVQLSEIELVRIQGVIDYDHTWEPFYHLAIRSMTIVRQHKQFGTNIGLQQLYQFLDRGRRNLRDIAIIMIEKHPEGLSSRSKLLLKSDDLAVCS